MKILNIQLKDEVYERVVDEAERVDRSVRNMVSVLVERGLNSINDQSQVEVVAPALDNMDVDVKVDYLANKFEENKRKKQEHPRLQAIKTELKELKNQLDDEDDSDKAVHIMNRIQELQKESNDINKEIEEQSY